MNVYRIDVELLGRYAFKQALLFTRDMLASVGIIILLLFIFSGFKNPLPIVLFFLPWIGLFLLVMFLGSFLKIGSYGATRYIIDDNSINRIQVDDEVDDVSKFFQTRVERKTGQRRNQFISFAEIDSINLSRHKIKIKSQNYDFMNAKGLIVIPCEVEKFEEISATIRAVVSEHSHIKLTDKSLS